MFITARWESGVFVRILFARYRKFVSITNFAWCTSETQRLAYPISMFANVLVPNNHQAISNHHGYLQLTRLPHGPHSKNMHTALLTFHTMFNRSKEVRNPLGSFFMMTSSNGNIFRVTGLLWGEFSAQRSVTRSFDVFSDLHLNKELSKQSRGWWFETPSGSLWRQCNVFARLSIHSENSRWSYFNEIPDDVPCMSFRFGFNIWLHNGHLLVNICISDCTQYVQSPSDVMFGLFWPAIPSIWRSPHSPMSPLFNNAGYCDSMERAPWFKVVLICLVKAKHFINPFAAPPICKNSYASDKMNTTTILFIYQIAIWHGTHNSSVKRL